MIATAGALLVGGAAIANAQAALSDGFRDEYAAASADRSFSPDARAQLDSVDRGHADGGGAVLFGRA